MVAAYVIVLPLLLAGAALGVCQAGVFWRETVRELKPGGDLRSQYRRNWAVGTRSRRRWFGLGGALWMLVAGCLILEFTVQPFWFFALWIGVLTMGWTAIAVVCTFQGVRAGSQ